MKFKISRAAFQDVLSKAMNTVPSKATMQILSNVMMTVTDDGKLNVVATNLDQTIVSETNCEVEENGTTTLPAKLLFGVVQKLGEGTVSLDVDHSDRAVISCGTSMFKISGMRSEDFPKLPEVSDEKKVFTVPQASLKSMLKKTSYAACVDETRRSLAGICLAFNGGVMSMIATDGRRLALTEENVENAPSDTAEFILPKPTAKELMRLLGTEGNVSIYHVSSQVFFEMEDGTKVVTKVVDEKYPPARNVIPDTDSGYDCVDIDRQTMLNAIDRVSVFMDDTNPNVLLSFRQNELVLVAKSSSSDYDARDSFPIKYDGANVDIRFNPAFILDLLKNISDDDVHFHVLDGAHPAVVKADGTYISVLMPLRGI